MWTWKTMASLLTHAALAQRPAASPQAFCTVRGNIVSPLPVRVLVLNPSRLSGSCMGRHVLSLQEAVATIFRLSKSFGPSSAKLVLTYPK